MNSNLASDLLNSKIRPRAVVGYGVKMFLPSPPNYVTRSPGEDVLPTLFEEQELPGKKKGMQIVKRGRSPVWRIL